MIVLSEIVGKSKMGRPTIDPKNQNSHIRFSLKEVQMLEYCVQTLNMKKSDVIRLGIERVYNDLQDKNSNKG